MIESEKETRMKGIRLDSLYNFDALLTAAPETKPNNGGKYSFKYRQKIDETKHTNLVKVRKRRRPS